MSRQIAVLVNPTSGKGKGAKVAPQIEGRLAELGVDTNILVGRDAQDALARARGAVAEGADTLIACGGDGTVHLALQAVAGTGTALAIVPVGTGNDNAREIGIPLKDTAAAIDIAINGRRRTIDAGMATTADGTQRWFMGVLSSGFDSLVNERANTMSWPSGQARYVVATLAELRTFGAVPYTVTVDGAAEDGKGMLVAVGNGRCYGGGMKVCEGALLDDGLLTLTWLHEVSKIDFIRTFPKVFSGTHLSHPQVSQASGSHVRLEAPDQVAYADGERIGPLPVDVEIRPGALTVMVPQS